ncbi:FAD-dependent oxidoreductase [Alkaliphilus serpentinus]|uniref:FAD-dependent oxidoreductase n=1 Tax=Alkaliphilus serpentinus TaxID=1482731 RepID=A0A833M8L2_9FIRM|nr:FAD-dependent oxidoreductase [Alkaliphilus serpentinus]KAB3524436.1 FAD-dependent oxidoreductase [Alkaliphilus serpentinus]
MFSLKDILPIFKKYELELIKKYKEAGDIFTFIFESPEGIDWKAGQHGIFTIKHVKIQKSTRAFSIASSPQEGHIKISMRISENPSQFKGALMDSEPGMKISMRGPIGSFYIKNSKPTLLIAGGIGITPFRGILKDLALVDQEKPRNIQLIYLDSSKDYVYKDELDSLIQDLNLVVKYLSDRETMNKEIRSYISYYGNEGNYFVVGPEKMTDAVTKLLKEENIKNIIKDTFIGY